MEYRKATGSEEIKMKSHLMDVYGRILWDFQIRLFLAKVAMNQRFKNLE